MANFQVNLLFKADTTAATNNIQQLGSLLTDISTKTKIGVDNGSLSQAVSSAQQLSIHLQNALNQNTGKLDLTKLSASLKAAGTDLQTLTTQLQAAGPAGQQAFIKIATAVASAEAPMIRVNQRLRDFGITLANTVKWQIASTAIHGVSRMMTTAVTHAEELNKALNDIRIVTGLSTNSMAKFAAEASVAAKELSTTTTEYAKASLIFYQQGLSGADVTERANVVVKLSQVTGQSAQMVSDQMTAIWNNFSDGTETLEYYADALTKLGASTAASTDEIAAGLEKFAAVAETVGLSYEYAAASVATVIDKTRQSADVVGTAFKTIFARMQGLNLGETLEDGVNLNKYSEALEKVGVEVLNADNELRDMDDILNDLGEKWQGFGRETQVAIAQTVAGVRQYNQMMSLMDNWDSVVANVDLAKNATGELTKQQTIWSESYEAAANRVKQAQNELYEKFINDKSIVKLNDIFAQLIGTISQVIDSMGGVLPMALTIAAVFGNQLFPLLQSGFTSLINNINIITGKAAQDLVFMQNSMRVQMQDTMSQAGMSDTLVRQISLSENLLVAKQKLTQASKNMSAAELEEAQRRMQVYEALVAETQQSLERQVQLEKEIALQREQLTSGTNRKILQEQAGLNTFKTQHSDLSNDYVQELFEDATTFNTTEMESKLNNSIKQYDQLSNAAGERTEEEKEQLQVLEGQIEKYKHILEIQSNIKDQRKNKDGKNISVGTVNTDVDYLTDSQHGRKMTESAVTSIGGTVSADGGIQVEATLNNLEQLYAKMGEYNTHAQMMKAMQQDLSNSFMSSDGTLLANQNALQASANAMGDYQRETENVANAQKAYDAAVRKATIAQQAAEKAGKKDAVATKALADAKANLQKKQQALIQAQSQQKAAYDKGTSSGKNYIKQLTSMESALTKAAASTGNAKEMTERISAAFAKIKAGDATQGLKEIDIIMDELGASSKEAVVGIDNIAASIQQKLVSSGLDPTKLQAFINSLVELGVISPEIAAKIRLVGETGEQLGPKVQTGATLAANALTQVASAAGRISMAISGITTFISAFEEGATPLETFSRILMSLTMILPALAGAIKLVSGAQQVNTLLTEGATIAQLKQMAADGQLTLSEGALTAVLWAKNAALAFGKALMGDYGALAFAAAAAATALGIAAVTGAISTSMASQELTDAQRKNNEATIEQTEQTNELTNAWIDQMSTMDTLIAKYNALRMASGDYVAVADDIIAQVPELIESYTALAESLNLTPEQMEIFNGLVKDMQQGAAVGGEEGIAAIVEAQNEMDALLSPEAAAAAREGANAAMSQTAQAIVDAGDASWSDNTITRHVGGAVGVYRHFYDADGTFMGGNEELASENILNKYGIGSKDKIIGGFNVALDTSSTENFIADYESLLAAQEEMENVLGDAVDNSDTYREISEMLANSQDEYQKLVELQAEAEKYGVIDAKTTLESQGLTLDGIDSYGAYQDYREALINQMQADNPSLSAEEAEAAADAWLRAQGAVEEYVKAEDKIGFAAGKAADEAERLAEEQGKSADEIAEAGRQAEEAEMERLEGIYDSLETDEERALFLEVDFNKYQSEEAIKAEIARLQGVAESEEIQVKINKIETAQSTLKESGMTQEDWTVIRDQTLDWGQNGIISFNEFLNMTYESQQQYLNDQMNAQQEALIKSKQETLQALQESLNDPSLSEAEQQAIRDNISLLEDELAIAERIAEEKAVEAEGIDYQEWQEYAKHLREVNGLTEDQIELSEEAALKEKKQIKAIKDLESNFSKYAKVIKAGNKQSEEYAEAINNIRENIELLTGTDISNFTDDFITNPRTLQALDDIANGVDGAIERFQSMAAVNAMVKLGFEMDDAGLIELENKLTEIQQQDYNVPIGATLDDSAAIQGLASLLMESGATAEQIQAAFNQIGWEPEIETRDYTVTEEDVSRGYISVPVGVDPLEITQVPLDSSVSSGMTVQLPYIKSATKTGVSGAGYKPQGNKGGGGGGQKKHAEKKSSSDRTRYHTLENQLEDLTDAYDKVSEAADRAFGKDKLKLIDEEIAATDDLIDKQEEYIDAISENLPKDKAIMKGYYNEIIGGPAMQFDEDGNISNYDDIEAAMHAKYNEMADKYTSDSEEWQQFEKQYEKVEQYIKQYEETYDLLRDEEGKYQELLNQRADLELTKIQYKAELSLNIEDDEIAVIEHQLDMLGDNAFKAAEAIELQIEKAEAVYDKIQVNQSALNDILGQQLSQKEIELFYSGDMSVLEGKSFTDNQVQAIKDYRDSLLDLNADMMEIRDNIQEQVMETFDAWNEKLEQGMSTLEHYGSVLESYSNIIDVVGKDVLGISDAFMTDLGEAQVSNAIDQVNAARDAYESMINAQTEAEAALAQARANGDEESIKYWEDTLQSITENAQSAQEELLGSWEEALSTISAQFEDAVQMVVDTFNDSVYALGGLEGLSEEFSRQLENSDVMLDDYHKIYELSKLTRDINNKLDDTKIIAGKQKLKDLLEEINEYQQEGVEMSQYDLEYLQAEYDLRLAEIELEEAQRAKSTVRMSRDNEGNWSYVYTQNTDAVDSAQQKYEDALYAMQDLSSNYIDEMSEQLISTSQEMQEALAAIRIQDYASIDEYYAEVERVQKQYQDQLAMQEAELNKAVENNKTLYDEDWTNYHNATGYKISDTQNFATTFKDTLLGTIMGSEEDTSNFTSIIGSAVQTMSDGLMQAAQTYYTNLEAAMQAAGTSTDNFAEDTEANIDAVVAKSKEGAAAVDQMAKEMDEAFSAITDKVSAWQETYGLAMQSIIDSNLAVVESFNAMLEAMSIDAGQITVNYDINTTPDGVDPAAFDTGGYTGEWGDAGKLAVLHEKEMILNQGDTEKFLKAMAYSKMILETIELNAKQASLGMGQIMPTVVQEEAPQTLEQMVHITAEFPGVNDHYEIEEAFNNLINKASQYANRKL